MNEFEICLVEFADNDALTNLESVLVQLAPKEAVFPSASSQTDETIMLQKVISHSLVALLLYSAIGFQLYIRVYL